MLGRAAAQHGFDVHARWAVDRAQAQALCHLRFVVMDHQALRRQQGAQRQFSLAVHPGFDFFAPAAPGECLQDRQQVGLLHGAALAALPQCAHHVVQRDASFAAQAQVQTQSHQRAFGVVAHRGVRRVLVLAVVLDPSVHAGLGHRLNQPTGRLHHLVDGFVQQLEIARVIEQAGAAQQQVVVVAGEAFKKPQQLGVVFSAVVIACKLGRAQLLHVPGVKILVADEAQQGGVALGVLGLGVFGCRYLCQLGQVFARANQGGGVAVLQPAVAIVHGVEHEQVVFMRGFRG